MQETVQFVLRHGYAILFAAVLAEQLGLPLPSSPVLLAMGALAGIGRFSLSLTLLLAVIASLLADTVWYWLGRRRGYKILNLLEDLARTDSCVRRTSDILRTTGPKRCCSPNLSRPEHCRAALAGLIHADVAISGQRRGRGTGLGGRFRRARLRVPDAAWLGAERQ
jgi:hypothetical protein